MIKPAVLNAACALACWVSAVSASGQVLIDQACAFAGCFSGDGSGFPVVIDGSAGTSYVLASDLIAPNRDTTLIQVNADAISIDLNGFALRGPNRCTAPPMTCSDLGSGVGINQPVATITGPHVRNGTVFGMGNRCIRAGRNARLQDLHVEHCGDAGIVFGTGSQISRVGVSRSGNSGIQVSGVGDAVITDVRVNENNLNGINAGSGSLVSRVVAADNSNDGIVAFQGSSVIDSVAFSNDADGIETSNRVLVRGNAVSANTGVGLRLGDDTAFRENVVTSNTGGTVVLNAGGGAFVNLGNNSCNGTATCP